MKNCFLILLIGFISVSGFSQQNYTKLREKEEELSVLLKDLRSAKSDQELYMVNDKFRKKLAKVLEIDGAFDFPFSALKSLGKITSKDQLVRVFTWNIQQENLMHDYFSFIMKKDERRNRIYITELTREKQPLNMILGESISSENWYGALYYDIIDVERRNRTFYTLLGYDANNQSSSIKLIDALYFTGSKPNFGYPFFETKEGRHRRVIFEHSNKATMSLKYDEQREKIIFDHLAPESPGLREFRSHYLPDMSYDAYNWDGKYWRFEEDVIAINKERKGKVELKAYDAELDSVVSVPVKKRWINPENSNSEFESGKHQAITPEDLKEKNKNKKKQKQRKKKKKERKKNKPNSNIRNP